MQDALDAGDAIIARESAAVPLTVPVTDDEIDAAFNALDLLRESMTVGEVRRALEGFAAGRTAGSASDELIQIHAVVLSIGGDWPEVDSDPYTLAHVKRMARDLAGFMRAEVAAGRTAGVDAEQEAIDGWKLVPIDPTQEMINAGNKQVWTLPVLAAYRSMFAATPAGNHEYRH
jgi:hypothetical protein